MSDDAVFRALADGSRRRLLDRLHRRNGQTLGELCQGLDMTRQAVAKHLSILAEANLVAIRRQGREKLHFINPVPINEIAERWISKFERPRLQALAKLKRNLEGEETRPPPTVAASSMSPSSAPRPSGYGRRSPARMR